MNNQKKVSVIIPNFNGVDLLTKNLPHVIEAKNNNANSILEVIVVDDGSTDNSIETIKSFSKDVVLIKHKKNRGFSCAVNTGVRSARGKYLCLLNTDVYPDKNFLVNPLRLFDMHSKLFGVSFHEIGRGSSKGAFKDGYIVHLPGNESAKAHSTFFVNAGGGLYNRDIWYQLGGLDELLYSPYYWEDVDISYRALKRGFMLLWDPKPVVSPNLSASVSKLPRKKVDLIQERNHLLFVWKNLTSKRLFAKHLQALLLRIIQHPGYFKVLVMAFFKIGLVLKSRKKEIKESKVSDEAIFAQFS